MKTVALKNLVKQKFSMYNTFVSFKNYKYLIKDTLSSIK